VAILISPEIKIVSREAIRHPRVALSGALDDRRHRLGEQVLDIKIWQLGAVFRLPASTRAATASARLFDRSIRQLICTKSNRRLSGCRRRRL
jgi:hypothetical protein